MSWGPVAAGELGTCAVGAPFDLVRVRVTAERPPVTVRGCLTSGSDSVRDASGVEIYVRDDVPCELTAGPWRDENSGSSAPVVHQPGTSTVHLGPTDRADAIGEGAKRWAAHVDAWIAGGAVLPGNGPNGMADPAQP